MVLIRLLATGIAGLCCGVLAACSPLVPASAPPQLTHTPGAYIEIADGHFNAGSFEFDYPSSWRLIKQRAADAEGIHIILRAPTGAELTIRVVETSYDEDSNFIPLANGMSLMATVDTSNDNSADLDLAIERIISSIRS